jgi:hypothetical protein
VILYRIFPYDRNAAPSERGGALFVPPPSGLGRIDNPDLYDVLYVTKVAEAAVAEVFGRLAVWRPETFVHASGLPYALARYEAPDDLSVFDLNDVEALRSLGIAKPTDVVTRDRAKTQAWAGAIFASRRHCGAEWWSYYDPEWAVLGLWDPSKLAIKDDPYVITSTSEVVLNAAACIVRQITT